MARKPGTREAGRLGGWEAGKLGSRDAGKQLNKIESIDLIRFDSAAFFPPISPASLAS